MNLVVRSLLILAVISFGAIGIGADTNAQELQSKLHGKWKPNVEKTKEIFSKLEGDQAMGAEQIDMMLEMMGSMTLEFQKEGVMKMTMSFGGEEQARDGKYEVSKVDEKEKTIEMKINLGDEDKGTIKFLSDDQIKISPGDGEPPIVLDRVKKKDD